MKNAVKIIILILLIGVAVWLFRARLDVLNAEKDAAVDAMAETSPSPAGTTPSPSPSPSPTPSPTPEPEPEYFTLSCVGDCTLWSGVQFENSDVGLPLTVGDDYAYPFKNTVQYFENDEFTLANLECTLSDKNLGSGQMFNFLAPSAYANIMTEGGVDFVTTANNHIKDNGDEGYQDTLASLQAVGLPYGTENQSQIVETKNGLKLGIYTAGEDMRPDWKQDDAVAAVKSLKEQGADYVICMFHWGKELEPVYDYMRELAHACADAGADLIYGSHPHTLLPIEEYNGSLILYSMGNWVFGGNTQPTDPDTAIIQVTLKRDVDGTVTTDGFTAIPCCVSSKLEAAASKSANYNDYCPTPYEEGSEAYQRVLNKLDGTDTSVLNGADYSSWYASWG